MRTVTRSLAIKGLGVAVSVALLAISVVALTSSVAPAANAATPTANWTQLSPATSPRLVEGRPWPTTRPPAP